MPTGGLSAERKCVLNNRVAGKGGVGSLLCKIDSLHLTVQQAEHTCCEARDLEMCLSAAACIDSLISL